MNFPLPSFDKKWSAPTNYMQCMYVVSNWDQRIKCPDYLVQCPLIVQSIITHRAAMTEMLMNSYII